MRVTGWRPAAACIAIRKSAVCVRCWLSVAFHVHARRGPLVVPCVRVGGRDSLELPAGVAHLCNGYSFVCRRCAFGCFGCCPCGQALAQACAGGDWRAHLPSGVVSVYKVATYLTRLETRTKESNMPASEWVAKPRRAMKVKSACRSTHDPFLVGAVQCGVVMIACNVANTEQSCWDPKDGELCLSRTKPEETLVEVRSGSDVQIDRQTWV